MFDNETYNFPVEKVLEVLGARKGMSRGMWFSPFRDEKEASLHVDSSKNLWFDHGLGQGGTVVQLVMLAKRCSTKEAIDFIRALDPFLSVAPAQKTPEQKNEIKRISEFRSSYLKAYLESRNIPLELANCYCKEIVMYSPQKGMHFTLVGFPNNSGGWSLNSPNKFKSTTKAAITTIDTNANMNPNPTARSVAVFEGFFDFLSWQVLQGSNKPTSDIVVLNSVNNLQKATEYIKAHERIYCFLDNDAAGQRCTTEIEQMCKDKEVTDMSDLYGEHKDLNEMLQNARGYSAQMKFTPSM